MYACKEMVIIIPSAKVSCNKLQYKKKKKSYIPYMTMTMTNVLLNISAYSDSVKYSL